MIGNDFAMIFVEDDTSYSVFLASGDKPLSGKVFGFGGRCRNRTCDPLIKSQLLYRLS